VPKTIFSDLRKSLNAEPSLKNSGFEQIYIFLLFINIFFLINSAVPGKTVDLITNIIFSLLNFFKFSHTL